MSVTASWLCVFKLFGSYERKSLNTIRSKEHEMNDLI